MKLYIILNFWLYCLVLVTFLNVVDGLPFQSTTDKIKKNQNKWTSFDDTWAFTNVPRSINPHILSKHRRHQLPEIRSSKLNHKYLMTDDISKGKHMQVNGSSRTTWFKSQDLNSNYPVFLNKAIKLFSLEQVAFEIENSVLSKVSCTACKAGAGLLQHYIKTGKSKDEIIKTIGRYCINLQIQSVRVCEGISHLFGNEVIYVLERTTLSPDEICSFVIGDACGDIYNPYHDWDVTFPPVSKPENQKVTLPKMGTPVFKVLHLSDTHYDPYYTEGSNADCNEPLCCRQGQPKSPQFSAGKWGDYRKCDIPKRTLDSMFAHIGEMHQDIDYILWTGDLLAHDIWNQTRDENLKIIKETVSQMSGNFPGIPIFPSLGNHESAPVNSFPPPYIQQVDNSINWLYDVLDSQWSTWLPDSVSPTVRRGGFYSVLVRPGFRIISLNMNYCNNKNWWLLLNSTDPATELQWLIYELQSSEFSNEIVHILGHIPPGHPDCLKVWSRNYYKIISRYENTIKAQFFGHTHYDEFEIFYDQSDISRANNIAYIGPSVTPYYDLNPGYRIYYIDGDHDKTTRLVIDHETWIMNLKDANLYDFPIWYKLYSARSAYNMEGLRPSDWDKLLTNMTNSQHLFDIYYKHYWKNSPMRPACDLDCKTRILCDSKSGRSHDKKYFCKHVESSKIDVDRSWGTWIFNSLSVSLNAISSISQLSKNIWNFG